LKEKIIVVILGSIFYVAVQAGFTIIVQGNTPRLLALKANDQDLASYLQGLIFTTHIFYFQATKPIFAFLGFLV